MKCDLLKTWHCHSTWAKRESFSFKRRWSNIKPGCQTNALFLNSWSVTQVWGRQHSAKHISRFLRILKNQGIGLCKEILWLKKGRGNEMMRKAGDISYGYSPRTKCKCLAAILNSSLISMQTIDDTPICELGNFQGAETRVTSYQTPPQTSGFLSWTETSHCCSHINRCSGLWEVWGMLLICFLDMMET